MNKSILMLMSLLLITSCNGSSGSSNNSTKGTRALNPANPGFSSQVTNFEQDLYCQVMDQAQMNIRAYSNGTLNYQTADGTFAGSYTISGNSLNFQFPDYNFNATTTKHETFKNILVTTVGDSIKCKAIGHQYGEMINESVRCPSIKYVPNVSMEKNFFHFTPDGHVKRVQQVEIPNDTITYTKYGVYYKEGSSIVLIFGDEEKERVLNAKIINGEVFINELEPERGGCQSYQ